MQIATKPSRAAAGYRVFSGDAVRRLRFIRHAKMLSLSLEEIEELLRLVDCIRDGLESPRWSTNPIGEPRPARNRKRPFRC